ncbi:MAG TPA: PQQ-binding-like beta-propeller repeat protein, partial [Gemmataceae bacterium]|nr:PQQ-binding-like beta-propeller repeat protein [Gemmataceae bacterium]
FFENTTVGTLSVDGNCAYTVADLVVPKPPSFRLQNFPGQPNQNYGWPQEVVDAISHNRLRAFDLTTGCRSMWVPDYFNPNSKESVPDLSGCFFLGPPLAVNGKLYVLSEKQQELRLICLENVKTELNTWKPKVVGQPLSLGVSRDSKLEDDALRRVNAAHLSYGEGVLVCPTNQGYVIGIDLLQNSLLWAYPYRTEPISTIPAGARVLPGGIIINPATGQQISMTLPPQGWRDCAPIIQDGKVIFTAFDSKSIHCINLRDGSPVWSKPRQEGDLYVGGVVNGKVIVVGQKVVRAYNLSNGEKSWEAVETGLPTGFGAASDNIYYVPLQNCVPREGIGDGKGPGICAVDVDRGAVVGYSKPHIPPDKTGEKPATPGNLIFFDGSIISQNNESVTAYPQMKIKLDEMKTTLAANPNDLNGLCDRGEFSLEQGDQRPGDTHVDDAVQDFQTVYHNAPARSDLIKRAKERLYDALTVDFQQHFDQAEKYKDEYAALCAADVPLDPNATEKEMADAKAEAARKHTQYLCLMAEGKQGQHKLTEAFDFYMQLNAEAPPNVPLPLVEDSMVKAAPDVVAQGRIASMMAGAGELERKPLEDRIAARWKEIQAKKDSTQIRQFVSMFGSLTAEGREARLQLAEQLLESDQETALIDAERQLSLLRIPTEDRELSARAVDCLARLNTRKGLLEDAAYYYRVLRDRYPDVKVQDGKTGADLFNEIATDKRLWAQLDDPPRLGVTGKLKADEKRGNYNQAQVYEFSHEGEQLPFFQRATLGMHFSDGTLQLTDRLTGEQRWKPLHVDSPLFQMVFNQNFNLPQQPVFVPGGMQQVNTQPTPTPRFSYMTLGHLVVVPVGNIVIGVDAISGKELWHKNLLDEVNGSPGASQPAPMRSLAVDPHDGSVQIVYADEYKQHLGGVGPLGGAAVCLQMRDALIAVDPVNGRVLWTRSDVSPSSHIFGDDQNLFVVEMSDSGKPASTRIFRVCDGETIPALDFHQMYEDRIRLVGRNILTANKNSEATTLRLYDPLAGKDLWKQTFAPKSLVMQAEDGDVAGVVELDDKGGLARVVDVFTGKELLNANSRFDKDHPPDKDATYTVLADSLDVYLVPNGPPPANVRCGTNLMPGTGLRGLNVNGEIYAFRRDTGKRRWLLQAADTQLVLNQFTEMPMLLLTGQTQKYLNQFQAQGSPTTSLLVVSKATGSRIMPGYGPGEDSQHSSFVGGQFCNLELNGRDGKIEFTAPNSQISIGLESIRSTP